MKKIELKNVGFSRKKNTILKNIDLTVHEGDRIALIGPNGAGKTSLVNLLTGINFPTSGQVINEFKSYPPYKIGVSLQEQQYNNLMKVKELLDLFLFEGNYDEFITKYNLKPLLNKKLEDLSGGEKQKVLLVSIFENNPVLFFLDEFTTGLDTDVREMVIDYLLDELKDNKTLVLVTHYLEEAYRLCDRFIFIKDGQIVEDDNLDNLISKYHINKQLIITLSSTQSVPNFSDSQTVKNNKVYVPLESDDLTDWLDKIKENQAMIESYVIEKPSLTSLYNEIYAKEGK